MKNRFFAFAVAIVLMAFAVNTTVVAQNKDTKTPPKTVKQTEQKIQNKVGDVKTKTEVKKVETTKEGMNTVKTDVKKDTEKIVKKTHKNVKHHTMPLKKVETKKTETEKK